MAIIGAELAAPRVPTDLVEIQTIAEERGISLDTVYRVINEERVRKYRVKGNRRTQVSRAEIERAFRPKPLPPKPTD